MSGQQTRGSRYSGKADTSSGAELETDRRARRSAARERDAPLQRAFEAGRRGDDPAEFQTDDELWGYYQDGASFAKRERRAERGDQLRAGAGARAASLGSDGAGFLLGLLGYALLFNYLRGGTGQVRAWFAAKFVNRTTATTAQQPAQPASPSAADPRSIRVGGA